jgi:hypothetical protein
MRTKFSSMWRVAIALVMVLSLGLVMALPAMAAAPTVALTTPGGGITSLTGTPATSGTEAGVHSIVVTDATVSTLTGTDAESNTVDDTIATTLEGNEVLTLTIGGTAVTTGALALATANTTPLADVAADITSKINAATTAPDVNVTVTVTGTSPGKKFLITVNLAGLSNSITGVVTGTNGGETETGLAGAVTLVAGTNAKAVDTFTAAIGSNGLWVADASYGNGTTTMTIQHNPAAGTASDLANLKTSVTAASAFINGITLAAAADLSAGTAVATVTAGTAGYLKVTGTATMSTGSNNELTVTAYDDNNNRATAYTGSKTLIFSGPGVAPDGTTAPTVEGVTMENATTVTFTAGVSSGANATLVAYKAETIDVDVTDGTIGSAGDIAYDLGLTVNALAATQLAYTANPATVVAGVETAVFTVQRQDQYDNPTTLGGALVVTPASTSTGVAKVFRATSSGAAVTTVTIAGSASTVNFYYYDEKAGAWTITASAGTLTPATAVCTVAPAGIDHYAVSAITSPKAIGAAFPVTIQAQDAYDNNITTGGGAAEAITITYNKTDDPATPDTITTTAAGTATVNVRLTVTTLGQSITFIGGTSTKAGTSNPFRVVAIGAIDHYTVTAIGAAQVAGTPFNVTIQAQDANNNNITVGADAVEDITITFGETDADATPITATTTAGAVTVSDMTMTVAQTGQTITFTGVTSGKSVTSNSFTVYDEILDLPEGWTLISIPLWINATDSAWLDEPVLQYKAAGSVFSSEVTLADLKPVEALYVKMDSAGELGIIYSTDAQGVSAKELLAGWNLISSANSDSLNAQAVLSGLRDVAGAGTGLTTVVSQGIYNRTSGDFYVDATEWGNLAEITLDPFDGYWIRMNAAKIFSIVPQP